MEPLFLTTIGEEAPIIMCELHARTFEQIMIAGNVPHTIYELDDEDAAASKCQACNLLPDLIDNQPRIILN
jgi:hypothetical protein